MSAAIGGGEAGFDPQESLLILGLDGSFIREEIVVHALVVDDSRAVRKILGSILREAGWSVTEADDGRSGLLCLSQMPSPPEVALVDWNMPDLSGLQFVQAVRKQADYADMRIMMVTTESALEKVIGAMAFGADEYLLKLFDAQAVRAKLCLMGLAS